MTHSELALRAGGFAGQIERTFEKRFGAKPRMFRAPGRVNLIGEHTDYNDGWVMPTAIEFNTLVAISPRNDRELHVVSLNFGEERSFSLDTEAVAEHTWIDYIRGVALTLRRGAYPISGANMMVWGDVPLGAGLSSSASVEVAAAVALLGSFGIQVSPDELALLCQRAENEFVGARCGIMDQFISANGRAGNALMLDCRSLHFELVSLPSEATIVVSNTMVKHQLAGGEYNKRRAECEEGVRVLQRSMPGVRALRDVSVEEFERHQDELPDVIYKRCRHVVSENERVLRFAETLRSGDLAGAGEMMYASHRSLRDDYEVSCPELDIMVDLASKVPGTIGSRMTGGGFGGCTVSLVENAAVESFRTAILRGYQDATGMQPEIYVTRAADGASELSRQ